MQALYLCLCGISICLSFFKERLLLVITNANLSSQYSRSSPVFFTRCNDFANSLLNPIDICKTRRWQNQYIFTMMFSQCSHFIICWPYRETKLICEGSHFRIGLGETNVISYGFRNNIREANVACDMSHLIIGLWETVILNIILLLMILVAAILDFVVQRTRNSVPAALWGI